MLATEDLDPLPPEGATPAEVEAWVERYIDTSARLPVMETGRG
ncbi:hypothetical protein [Phenylobacterium sp. J367]|nr:hypothetical protein [Phenylobacterium sp. J367]